MKRKAVIRAIALGCVGTLTFTFTACGTDRIVAGSRPNAPLAQTIPTTPSTEKPTPIDITTLPGYVAPKRSANYTFSKPLIGLKGNVDWQVFNGNNTPIDPKDGVPLAWGNSVSYTTIPGVLTFRGNPQRTAPTYGTAEIKNKKLEVVWTHDIGAVHAEGSYFPGAGWTGQPLLVNWPRQSKEAMGFAPAQINDKNFVEVVYPVFDGNIYRLDLKTGKKTKDPIVSGFGFKGTGSIDPRGYPLLFAGQGLHEKDGKTGEFRYRIFDLIHNTEIGGIPGKDIVSKRTDPVGWGAFDSSGLIDKNTDTLIEAGENGVIYKLKLNSSFNPSAKSITINPSTTKMVYGTSISVQRGIESSPAAWRNLMYATDNDGNLVCWDATTLNIVWTLADKTSDNADATVTLDDTSDGPMLYTGNSVGWRGFKRSGQVTNLRKVDGRTGKVLWQFDIPAFFNWKVKGGLVGSPLLGKGEASDLIVFNVARTSSPSEGNLVALDKKTGKVVWNRHQEKYSWSSPVSITSSDGKQYGAYGDSAGILHLFDMNTGKDYSTISLGGKNIEASISAYNDMLVVANYDKKIWGIRVS